MRIYKDNNRGKFIFKVTKKENNSNFKSDDLKLEVRKGA